jgi:hypothetical protein
MPPRGAGVVVVALGDEIGRALRVLVASLRVGRGARKCVVGKCVGP